jgi:hypothetical protein
MHLTSSHLILKKKLRSEEFMAALIDAIDVKRKMLFEFEDTPFYCLEAEVNTPTARGGQTLVRLKMRNLLTNAVFEKSFRAGDKFKDPDLVFVPASYLYSDCPCSSSSKLPTPSPARAATPRAAAEPNPPDCRRALKFGFRSSSKRGKR